jgi:hypothetical protein
MVEEGYGRWLLLATGYISAIPSGTCQGWSGKEIFFEVYIGEDEKRNSS